MTALTVVLLIVCVALLTQVKRGGPWPLATGVVAAVAVLLVVSNLFRASGPQIAESDRAFFDDVQEAAYTIGGRVREAVQSNGSVILVANSSSSGIVGRMERYYIDGFTRGLGPDVQISIFDPLVHGRPGGYVWGNRPVIPPPMWEDVLAHDPRAKAIATFIGLPPVNHGPRIPVFSLLISTPEGEIDQWLSEGGQATVLARVSRHHTNGREAAFVFLSE